MSFGKYKKPPQAPPTFIGSKESILADAEAICDRTRGLLNKLVAEISTDDKSKATFNAVLGPQIANENELALSEHILSFYKYVSSDSTLRDASTEATKLMGEFHIECNMREDVFKIVEAVYQLGDTKELDPESARLLEKEYKSYIRNGLGLPAGPEKDRFKEIQKRLSQIQIEFQKNLNEETGGMWFTKEELNGVPADVIGNLEKGTGENEGKVRLTFKYPDLKPTLKFAEDAETRRRLFVANENTVCPRFPCHIIRQFFPIWPYAFPYLKPSDLLTYPVVQHEYSPIPGSYDSPRRGCTPLRVPEPCRLPN